MENRVILRLLQGVTGFGSSIALLSVWVLSRAVGIRACEACCCCTAFNHRVVRAKIFFGFVDNKRLDGV